MELGRPFVSGIFILLSANFNTQNVLTWNYIQRGSKTWTETVAALQQRIYHCIIVVVQLSLSNCHCPFVTDQLSWSNCRCPIVVVQLSLSNCRCPIVVVQLTQSCCCCPAVIVLLSCPNHIRPYVRLNFANVTTLDMCIFWTASRRQKRVTSSQFASFSAIFSGARYVCGT
jgi:hypothetical protein